MERGKIKNNERILSLAKEAGQSGRAVKYILDLMGAHPDLIDLPRISKGLIKILNASELGVKVYFGGIDKTILLSTCEWIASLGGLPNIEAVFGKSFWLGNSVPTRNPVLNHGVTMFGFPYAAIWHAPRDSENEQDYYRLLAQLLSVFQGRNTDGLQSQRYAVFLDLRRLCNLVRINISDQLKIWGETDAFVSACRVFNSQEIESESAKALRSVCRLVAYCSGDEPKVRSGGGGHHGPRQRITGPELSHLVTDDPLGFALADPDDPDQLPGHYSILSQPTGSADGELAPEELSAEDEIWLLDDDGCERPYVADVLGQQGIEAHIVRSRQCVPFPYNQFTLSELRDLLFGASDLFYACRQELGHTQDPSGLRRRMEAILMIHVCLWLGQPAAQVFEMTVANSSAEGLDGLVLISGAPAQFSMTVRRPSLVGDGRWQATSGVRRAALRILLPDLAGSSAMFDALRKDFPRSSSRVFTCEAAELESEVKAVLHLLGGGDRRFTLTKLQNYLFLQIVSDTQDVAVASMLSGVMVPSAQTPRFYLQLDANYLRQIYVDSLERVLTQVYACAGLAYEPIEFQGNQVGGLGATHCLLPETIKANVCAMAEVLRKKPKGRGSEMLAWHNCYTMWTVQMFMLITGCRAIGNPLLFLDEFDKDLVMGALCDKDSGDRHMSRLICMPPMLRRQIEHYFLHCAAISRELTGYLPPADVDGRWSRGFFLRITPTGWRREEITPSGIFKQMELVPRYRTHRINGYRKFIRTELAERGCPIEPLAAYMGHWLRGEEPQDQYSSFCPATYAKVLDEWVTPLLTELKWSAFVSPWVEE